MDQPSSRPLPAETAAPTLGGDGLAGLRSRLWYKGLDAVLTAPLRPGRSLGRELGGAFSPVSSHYDRVGAAVHALDRLFPGAAGGLSARLLGSGEMLPLAFDSIRLLGYGSGATAFLLRRGEERLVLKVYRRSLGRPPRQLARVAAELAAKVRTVAGWYGRPYGLPLPGHHLILRGPLRDAAAVALVQPFVAGEKRDLFQDATDDELLSLAAADPDFGRRLAFFAARTAEIARQEDRCLDFIGRHNVALARQGDGWALRVLDYGALDLKTLPARSPKVAAQVAGRLARLQRLAERLEPAGGERE
jgi:hypothetical protein